MGKKIKTKSLLKRKNIIPKKIAKSVPDLCPVCNKSCAAVFRTWKPTGRVSCEFLHDKGKKVCKKTYDIN